MPLSLKGRKIKAGMIKQYGKRRGEEIFLKSLQKGAITGVEAKKKGTGKR